MYYTYEHDKKKKKKNAYENKGTARREWAVKRQWQCKVGTWRLIECHKLTLAKIRFRLRVRCTNWSKRRAATYYYYTYIYLNANCLYENIWLRINRRLYCIVFCWTGLLLISKLHVLLLKYLISLSKIRVILLVWFKALKAIGYRSGRATIKIKTSRLQYETLLLYKYKPQF